MQSKTQSQQYTNIQIYLSLHHPQACISIFPIFTGLIWWRRDKNNNNKLKKNARDEYGVSQQPNNGINIYKEPRSIHSLVVSKCQIQFENHDRTTRAHFMRTYFSIGNYFFSVPYFHLHVVRSLSISLARSLAIWRDAEHKTVRLFPTHNEFLFCLNLLLSNAKVACC